MAQGLHQCLVMETLGLIFEGCLVTPLEAIFYVSIVTIFSLMRLPESCLINTFSFAYYWGFKSLLISVSASSTNSDQTILLYSVSGLMIFALVHISYIKREQIVSSTSLSETESVEAN